jgi:CO/xanthine dehydrogenase Mo-binding subunit
MEAERQRHFRSAHRIVRLREQAPLVGDHTAAARARVPLRTDHLRDPLGAETHFASESFIDEVAHAAGVDPAAIANAIFDATGVRLRKVPLTAERMKEALARAAIA